jgi:DNA-binding NarL/FixJ family response regulator
MTIAGNQTPSSSQNKTRILLVDDHSIVRRGLASLINSEPDLEVCGEAEDVQSAIDAVNRSRPQLVILDLSLKHGDGLDVLARLSEAHPEVLTLVLSMFDETVYAERALRAGARGYVRKLDVAETIVAAIRQVLAGQVYVSSTIAAAVLQHLSGGNKRSDAQAAVHRLTDRELQVLRSIGRGLSNHQIAEELFISVKTVEAHREHIKQKIGFANSSELLQYAIEFTRL